MVDKIVIGMKGMIEDWIVKPFIWFAIILANIEH